MRLGVFAKTFAGADAATVLGAVRSAGFETAQFNMACVGLPSLPDVIDAGTIVAIASAARATGVSIAAVSGTFNMAHPDHGVRDAGLGALDVIAGACRGMGTRLVTLCTGTRDAHDQWRHHPDNARPEAWSDLRQTMLAAIDIAERHDIELGIEPELANIVSSAALARRLIDELGSTRLRIVLDPANLFEVESEENRKSLIEEAIELLGDRIALAHAKDRFADGRFAAAGQGVVDFRHFVRRLRAVGFDGPLVTHGLTEAEAPGVARHLAAALEAA